MMIKWLRGSGLVVNDEKTEVCLFFKRDHVPINLSISNKVVKSKKCINVLGVLFDSKLQWTDQVAQSITKLKKSLHAIRLITKYLTKNETKQLLTSNFYSVLYYNCEIWMLHWKIKCKGLFMTWSYCNKYEKLHKCVLFYLIIFFYNVNSILRWKINHSNLSNTRLVRYSDGYCTLYIWMATVQMLY